MIKWIAMGLIFAAGSAQAAIPVVDNGICQTRVLRIRDDIRWWIQNGGSAALTLPTRVNLADYNAKMLDQLSRAQITCVGDTLKVGDSEERCKVQGSEQILCNSERIINDSPVSYQYGLVNHAYAQLAQIETDPGYTNTDSAKISKQLENFLKPTVELSLSPTLQTAPVKQPVNDNFKDFVGDYELVTCKVYSSKSPVEKPCPSLFGLITDPAHMRVNVSIDDMGYAEVTYTNVNGNDITVSYTAARTILEPGTSCSTFYGEQFCQAITSSGAYSNHAKLSNENGLTTFLNEEFDSLTAFHQVFVLKKIPAAR
jgi:hypothetical protein